MLNELLQCLDILQDDHEGLVGVPRELRALVDLFIHQTHGGSHLVDPPLDTLDNVDDFTGGLSTAFGQLTHFIGDHGESAAGVAGTGSFDSRVESQQVGLISNIVDDLNHLFYPRSVFLQGCGKVSSGSYNFV